MIDISAIQGLIEQEKQRIRQKNWFPTIHVSLMEQFGWIPIQELKDMPLPTFWKLLDEVNKRNEIQKREMDKQKSKIKKPRKR